MLNLAMSLNIVLPSDKVPEEVAPIHEIHLISQKEAQILAHCWHAVPLLYSVHPLFVSLGMTGRIHSWKFHVILVNRLRVVANNIVLILRRIGRWSVDGSALFVLSLIVNLATISRAIEKRSVSVLLTIQVTSQRKDISGRILAHRRIGISPNEDDSVTAVACQYHQKASQRQLQNPPPNPIICKDERSRQQNNIEDESCIIRTAHHVGKQQFEPSANPHHSGNETIENDAHQQSSSHERLYNSEFCDTLGLSEIDNE